MFKYFDAKFLIPQLDHSFFFLLLFFFFFFFFFFLNYLHKAQLFSYANVIQVNDIVIFIIGNIINLIEVVGSMETFISAAILLYP